MDREHHAVIEPVVQPVVRIVCGTQTCLKEIFILVPGRFRRVCQGMPARRGPAETIFLDCSVLQPSGVEIFKADGPSLIGMELLLEELAGIFRDKQETLVPLTVRYVLRRLLFLDYLDVVFPGKVPQSLNVGQMLVVHDEPDGGAALVAAEAIILPFGRNDVERRRLLTMERTAGPKVGPTPSQSHEVADHLFHTGGVKDFLYRFLRNHPTRPPLCSPPPWHHQDQRSRSHPGQTEARPVC